MHSLKTIAEQDFSGKLDYLVSICCVSYNHGPYIKNALDSILMQKVDFSVQIIIGEDCSSDNTMCIINEYNKKYPNIFTILDREKNVGGKQNFIEVHSLATGKYVIDFETDDYWLDELKLKKQVEWLETHPNIIGVTHLCKMVGKFNEQLFLKYPSIKGGYYRWKDFENDIMPGQTATLLYRNFYHYPIIENYDLYSNKSHSIGPGDRKKYFVLNCYGKIYCIPEYMSAYRFVPDSGSSYAATHKSNFEDEINYYQEFLNYARLINKSTASIKAAESLYMRSLWVAFLHKKNDIVDLKKLLTKYSNIKYKFHATFVVFFYYCRRLYFGKNYYYHKILKFKR